MKRLVISLLLLAFVLGINFYGINYVTNRYEEIDGYLSLCISYIEKEDFANAKEQGEKAEKLYSKTELYMAAFVNHSILDDIGVKIAAVVPLINEKTVPECLSSCREAKVSLVHLRNDHKFLIGNLF